MLNNRNDTIINSNIHYFYYIQVRCVCCIPNMYIKVPPTPGYNHVLSVIGKSHHTESTI